MIFLHLRNRPDVTVVQNQLLEFLHVREGGRTLGVGDHDSDHVELLMIVMVIMLVIVMMEFIEDCL